MSNALCQLCLGGPADRRVDGYRIQVCLRCWGRAAEGWPRFYEPALLEALGRAGLLIPDRNTHALFPRQYSPPEGHTL